MIEQTKGNKEEMMKIVSSLSGNKQIHKMMMENNNNNSKNKNSSLEPRGIMVDSLKKNNKMKNQVMYKK